MKSRRHPLIGLGLTAMLLLTACGGGDAASEGLGEVEGVSAADGLGGEENVGQFEEMYTAAVDEGQTTLNIYTPLTATWPHVFEAFQERFPEIQVEPLQVVGAELNTKIAQEQSSGQRIADLVLDGDNGSLTMVDGGAFQAFTPFNAEEVSQDPQTSIEGGTLTPVSVSPRGFFYDTRQDLPVPTSWDDLLDPALKGKITMTDFPNEPSGKQLGQLILGEEELGAEYLEALRDNGLTMASSTTECHNNVVTGRSFVCIGGAMGNYLTLKGGGAPAEFVFPIEGGNWGTFWYAGVVDQASNAKAAELFVTWLNSPEANQAKSKAGHGWVANGEDVELPFENPTEVDLFTRPDLKDVPAAVNEARTELQRIFG